MTENESHVYSRWFLRLTDKKHSFHPLFRAAPMKISSHSQRNKKTVKWLNKPLSCDRLSLSSQLEYECEVILQEEMTNTQTTMITLMFPSGHNDQQNTQITTLR